MILCFHAGSPATAFSASCNSRIWFGVIVASPGDTYTAGTVPSRKKSS